LRRGSRRGGPEEGPEGCPEGGPEVVPEEGVQGFVYSPQCGEYFESSI